MPDDTKKKQQKGKNDPKEQRRQRQRHQAGRFDEKSDSKSEEPKVDKPSKPEEPSPEFYKNLKRETDEILKITEEENSKYKKKEIQSNWSKYEMPIENYDEIDEQEMLGADYEKLVAAPLSIGGHFQFKHEKSWDKDIGPTPYDKYFNINMDKLFLAICTVPFYVRNDVPIDLFTEAELVNMKNKANKSKQKYYNENAVPTPELDTLENSTNIQQSVTSTVQKNINHNEDALPTQESDTTLENSSIEIKEPLSITVQNVAVSNEIMIMNRDLKQYNDEIDLVENLLDNISLEEPITVMDAEKKSSTVATTTPLNVDSSIGTSGIQSSEDLEKWLDDFLDN